MTFNIIAAIVMFFIVGGAVLIATWPDPPWTALQIGLTALMVVFPIVFFPFARTLWLAFDLFIRPVEPGEFAEGEPRLSLR